MKKSVTIVAILLSAVLATPVIVNATTSDALATAVSSEANVVTIYKKTGNVRVSKKVSYFIQSGDVYIMYNGESYKAKYSSVSGYEYCVDFGGRNNVWYFNLN